jgi:hypothetical protein
MIGNVRTLIRWLSTQEDGKIFEVKERKPKRSLTQNSYYWAMLNNLASVMRLDNERVHFLMLQRYGVYEVVSVRSDIDVSGYFRYFTEIGHGRTNGREFTHYKVFKGSSQMDSREFSVLIDGVRQECEDLDIPALTRDEISQLKFIGVK